MAKSKLPKDIGLRVALRLRIRADAVTLLSSQSREIGVLDLRTAKALSILLKDNPSLEFEAFVDQDQPQRPMSKEKAMEVIPLCINVYGPIVCFEKVRSALSEISVYLQEPFYVRPTSIYHNPHFLNFDDTITPRFLNFNSSSQLDFTTEVDAIFERSGALVPSDTVPQDQRIRTQLQEYDLSNFSSY